MAFKNTIAPLPLTSIDSATFTGTYQLLSGAGGLTNATSILRIINNSNKDITVSYDGTHDHDFIPTLKELNLSLQTNSLPTNKASCLPRGTLVYVKGAAGVGLVYLAGWFTPVSLV